MKTKVVKVSGEAWIQISKLKIDEGYRRKETIVDGLLYAVHRMNLWDMVKAYCEEAERE